MLHSKKWENYTWTVNNGHVGWANSESMSDAMGENKSGYTYFIEGCSEIDTSYFIVLHTLANKGAHILTCIKVTYGLLYWDYNDSIKASNKILV